MTHASSPTRKEERAQQEHFDTIASRYEAHYGDEYSMRFRDAFIYPRMFHGVALKGKRVLEAMCASGQTTAYMRSRGAHVVGLDISSALIASFQNRWPGTETRCASILDTGFPDASFDAVVVAGGLLHHVHPDVQNAVAEIARILKPGGYFCFYEPHSGSFPDRVRKLWYRHDPFFEKNEGSVDIEQLKKDNRARFDFLSTTYLGNIAYLFVYNSMIFRIPLPLKKWYAPPLLRLEKLLQPLFSGKRNSCMVICQWRKR